MAYQLPIDSPALSALKIDHIVFDELHFERKGFCGKGTEDLDLEMSVSVDEVAQNVHRVSVLTVASRKDEYSVKVKISAFCSVADDFKSKKDEILRKNVVAILFPYIRSEITLLTAQPETEPIILPPININGLIESNTLAAKSE